ncbi:hypothetical protein GOEFS_036_00960 [Gordonia effusa NBRC 100432]|uniref:Uncharacterized protein n=1 Tax=Gordonia effusa NBRC 100432 TaxID=1077974 RepID=H0QXV6_9ACTN|nr:hypothetical protein [Gordonia effusa]GAB17657.1 hypothetical protein GOEFS_036_00960 [Gordonia effusa NBRC 100432]
MSRGGLNPGAMAAAQRVSTITTIVGSLILMIFVGLMTSIWWGDERWGWVILGVVVIVVNVVFVVLQLKKLRKIGTKPASPPK